MKVRIPRSPMDIMLTRTIRLLTEARDEVREHRRDRLPVFRKLAGVQANCELVKIAIQNRRKDGQL